MDNTKKASYHLDANSGCGIIVLIAFGIGIIGYIMNFQNLWQYWPDASNLSVLQFFEVVSIRWLLSFVGVFLPPLGVITGFIW